MLLAASAQQGATAEPPKTIALQGCTPQATRGGISTVPSPDAPALSSPEAPPAGAPAELPEWFEWSVLPHANEIKTPAATTNPRFNERMLTTPSVTGRCAIPTSYTIAHSAAATRD